MTFCPNCGTEVPDPNQKFCISCGIPLEGVNFDDILKRLLMAIPETKAVILLSTDGLPIASALPQGVNETRIASLTAALHALANYSVIEMKKGKFDQLYIKGSNGYVLVQQAGPNAVLAVSTSKDIHLGLMSLDTHPQKWPEGPAYHKIVSLMRKESVNKLVITREYLPEIFSGDILEIANDGFPTLKSFAIRYFQLMGIKTKIYGKLVEFLRSYD